MEILEIVIAFADFGCCFLEALNVALAVGEGVAFTRSAPNRAARKAAKLVGEPPPPKDFWFQALVILTPMLITATILVIIKWTFLPNR